MVAYAAIGFNVSDAAIERNGKVEHYGERLFRADAAASWLYTHKVHDRRAEVSTDGVGNCPKCGQFAIVALLAH